MKPAPPVTNDDAIASEDSRAIPENRRRSRLMSGASYGWRVDPRLAPVETPEWPREGLERVSRCPVCDSAARHLLYENLVDRSYSCAPGDWTVFRCEGCSCAYLDPRPDEQTAHLAYANYYDGAEGSLPDEPTDRWRRMRRELRNGYLNSRYGY